MPPRGESPVSPLVVPAPAPPTATVYVEPVTKVNVPFRNPPAPPPPELPRPPPPPPATTR